MTVAKEVMKMLPSYDLVYFGDTARTPYGNKSKEMITKYALEDADFLIKKGAKILIVACNTVSALVYDALHEKYPDLPIFEVITPAVEEALKGTKNGRIGVIGTRATVQSGIYERKLKEAKDVFVESRACPLFVPLIEENWIKHPELKMIARRYLSQFHDYNIDTLILGCTHYPLIKEIIAQRIGKHVRLIDSASALAARVKKFLEENPGLEKTLSKNNNSEFYVSDLTEQCKRIVGRVLGKNIKLLQA